MYPRQVSREPVRELLPGGWGRGWDGDFSDTLFTFSMLIHMDVSSCWNINSIVPMKKRFHIF